MKLKIAVFLIVLLLTGNILKIFISDNVKAKVILVGNNRDPERMEKLLNKTNISLLSMSRPFFHEPGIVARWEKGDLAPSGCLACGRCYSPSGNGCILRRKG